MCVCIGHNISAIDHVAIINVLMYRHGGDPGGVYITLPPPLSGAPSEPIAVRGSDPASSRPSSGRSLLGLQAYAHRVSTGDVVPPVPPTTLKVSKLFDVSFLIWVHAGFQALLRK